ncbi:MAG: hypothetical protein PHX43_08510 [Alphaproteobacteria bacterium]|nr:hypothetical protein [Alphaproteobacteria bacterium]
MYTVMISDDVIDAYKKANPKDWVGVACFALEEIEKEMNSKKHSLGNWDDLSERFTSFDKIADITDVLSVEDTDIIILDADSADKIDCFDVMQYGARFMNFMKIPFVKSAQHDDVLPLVQSIEAGDAILGVQVALDEKYLFGGVLGGDRDHSEVFLRLKKLFPKVTVSNLIDFLYPNTLTRPSIIQDIQFFLANSLDVASRAIPNGGVGAKILHFPQGPGLH